MKTLIHSTLCFIGLLFFMACANDELDYTQELNISLEAPAYSERTSIPMMNGVSGSSFVNVDQVIHLGRVLFYDQSLSAGSTVACGSCHLQQFAFADPFKHSVGIGSQLSERNTPTIINTAFGSGLFWDQSVESLSGLVTRPIGNHKEMGFANMDELITKLSGIDYYPTLFEKAFGHKEFTEKELSDALAMFCGQLTSFDSEMDLFSAGESNLTPLSQRGLQVFEESGCNNCHAVTNNGSLSNVRFADIDGSLVSEGYTGASHFGMTANIGLNVIYSDNGVGALSGNSFDDGHFKIPTLRNAAITPPYMHDGRFATLRDVVDFYNDGIKPHRNLDSRLKDNNGAPRKLNLADTDKDALVAFLESLTSDEILRNPDISDPFK